jgi:hypothetical protein
VKVVVGVLLAVGELVVVGARVGVSVDVNEGKGVVLGVTVGVGVSVDVKDGIGVKVCAAVTVSVAVKVGVTVGGASAMGVPPRLKMLFMLLQVDSKVTVTSGLEAAKRDTKAAASPIRAIYNCCLL